MPISLAVYQHSSSFADTLRDLALEAGVDQVVPIVGSTPEGPSSDWDGIVVAAGGLEGEVPVEVRALTSFSPAPLVVLGTEPDHHVAASIIRAGALEYFVLPQDLALLRAWIEERVARAREQERARDLRRSEADHYSFDAIVGQSSGLRDALGRLSRIIPRDGVTVLLTGETGTGKELFAQALHYHGPRRDKPFVEVNCAALPASLLEAELFGYERGAFTDARTAKPGLFETADGGTLFLDEIGDLAPDLQVKLLKVLEDRTVRRLGSVKSRTVDIRLVAATHVDLAEAVREARFRQDLFYRLNVIPIHIPPLRDRGEDVLLLARHFVEAVARRHGMEIPALTPSIMARLRAYDWPGNVRELRNAMERAALLGDGRLNPDDLALGANTVARLGAGPLPFPASLAEIERAAAVASLAHTGGNKSAAADLLGISRTRLYRLLDDV
jgi:DNA-binding NtrC family response regulator